jgi:O-antigen biosynthesis protein
MKLSVIIPAYNNLPGVLVALNSLRALAADNSQIEYIVADDASPDVQYAALVPKEIATVYRNPANVGFGANCNLGAARATGDVLFFVNQDVQAVPEFSRGWDAALLAAFDDPAVGIVGARLLFPDGRVQSAGGLFDGACQPFHPCLGWSQVNHPDVATGREMPWVTGAAMAVRKWVWQTLGGFDLEYRHGYWEDVDLCCRAREKHIKVLYEPNITLIHSVGSTGGNPMFMKNATVFYRRWVETKRIKPNVPTIYEHFWA